MKKNPYKGKFIVIEGLDGSGKSTQAGLLIKHLKTCGMKAHATLEPTQYLIGGLIRSFLAHDWKSTPQCLQLLFCADRAYHLDKEIIPVLNSGGTVICDRYFFSTVAYGAADCDFEWLIEVNQPFILPDLTIALRSSPKICVQRMAKERFSVELFEHAARLENVWENYKKIIERFEKNTDIRVLDGDRKVEAVFEDVKKIMGDFFKNEHGKKKNHNNK